MKIFRQFRWSVFVRCSVLAAAGLAVVPRVPAATINVTYNSLPCDTSGCTAVPVDAQTAFNKIVQTYGSLLTNNVTVYIELQFGTTGLGQSDTQYSNDTYTNWRAALANNYATQGATNPVLGSAVASLPAGSNPVTGNVNSQVNFTTANAKALGFAQTTSAAVPDSIITLSNAVSYEYNSTATVGSYDFMNVAEHELDEALGISSAITGDNAPVPDTLHAEDYFRYSGPGTRAVTNDPNAQVSFSDDGGTTLLAQFNQDGSVGDTNDWTYTCTGTPGPFTQDATTCTGVVAPSPFDLGSPEAAVLQSLGWAEGGGDLTPPTPAPEPATTAITSLGVLGLALMRRRRALAKNPAQ